ncbi:oligosaccharide flippase family protein [Burkholderia sp. AU19243]|uniref:oligosaccharide flippase family protein n=1 Tax=Burkholderia TaxID=32008 RepID=UPI0008418905|nr:MULTISPECIES: oligosaccharide flippase family protein [Burkholderia]MBR8145091.1 oligosaccharide flippase family protein [Burkholderia vietnamiensis]AOK06511.1 translocase [Burkholderia latens]MBR8363896.1 oligosaccharide flippase family protein [Burkholderia sp. AU19243]MBY4693597.1 oligosaccharide flippase family protein [Burkholderia latens]MCA8308843.1 oligosaccharide flippase family protein [Burkholderia sp. AU28942]
MINPRDSIVSLAGVVAGQIALFVCIFVIGRRFGPESLGHFNYLLALATFIGTLLALRYELACVDDVPGESFNAFVNVTMLSVAVVAGVTALLAIAGRGDLYPVSAYALATFVQLAAGSYLNSLRRYGWIALSRVVVNGAFLAGLMLSLACDACAHVDVFALYTWVSVAVSIVMAVAILLSGYRSGYSFRLSREFFVRNRRFALYILPSTLCASVLTYALSIAIPHWFDAQSAGYFAAAYRLGFFPVSLIAQSVGGVFRRDAIGAMARADAGTTVPRVYRIYARALTALAAIYLAGGLVLFAPLVNLFFGESWRGSVGFYHSLMPLFALQLIYVPLSQIFLAARAQRIDFLFQLTCGVCLAGALCIARLMDLSAATSVQVFSLTGTVLMAAGIALTYRVLGTSLSAPRAVA